MKVDNYYPYNWGEIIEVKNNQTLIINAPSRSKSYLNNIDFWESDYKLTEKTLFTNKYIAKKKFINGKLKKIQIWVK